MLNFRGLSKVAYQGLVSKFIKITEDLVPNCVNIGDGKATIGFGYTFNRSNNVAIWTASGIVLSIAEHLPTIGIGFNLAGNTNTLRLVLNYPGVFPANDATTAATLKKNKLPAETAVQTLARHNAIVRAFSAVIAAGSAA